MKRIYIDEDDHILIGGWMLLCFGLTSLVLGPLIVVLGDRTPPILFYILLIGFALAVLGFIIGLWGFWRVDRNRAKRTEEFIERLKSIESE